MALFTLDELVTPASKEEVQASIYQALATLGVNTTLWKSGGVVRTTIVGMSIVLAALSQVQARIARSGFLELSEGAWLTLVAHHVYGEDRFEATFAAGKVTLTNTGGGLYSLDPGDLIVSNGDKTYRNLLAFTLNPTSILDVDIEATEVGSASSTGPGTIDTLVTTLTNVTCTNASSVTGVDEESDALLRQRCYLKLGSLSPFGPWDAYLYAMRTAADADGVNLGVTRGRITKDGYGNVNIYCATATGAVPGTVGDLGTPLGLVDYAIQTKAAPESVTANTFAATEVPISVTYEVWMYNTTGRTVSEIAAAIQVSLSAFIAAQPVGGNVVSGVGTVYLDGIRRAIASAFEEIFHVDVTSPAGDTTLTFNEVATLPTTPTVTAIHQVPRPEGFGA